MKHIIKYALYLPLVLVAGLYFMHAFGVFSPEESAEYFEIVSALGFNATLTGLLVWGVLPLDGTVGLLILFGNKISRNFPWSLFFIWATLWPWVPRILEIKAGMNPEFGTSIAISILSIIAYYLYKKKGMILFSSN